MFRIVITLFLFRFFIMAAPIIGMFSAFMLESEQTPMGIALVFAAFMIAVNLFEVPSSIIADKFSRKKVIIAAIIILILCNLPFLFSLAHWVFVLHMVIAGVAVALFSGTVEALVYDELKAINQEHKYKKANAIYHIAFSLGLSASLFLSSWLVEYGWYTIIMVSIFFTFVSLVIFTFGMKETKRVKEIDEPHSFREIFAEGSKAILHNKVALYLALLSFIFGAVNSVFGDVAVITSIEIGWSKSEIARVFGFNTIFEALITIVFARYVQKIGIKQVHYIQIIVLICAFVGMFFAQKWSIFMVFPLWWCDRLKNMVVDAQIQDYVKSSSRATATSFVSMCFSLKYILLMLLMGFIATHYSFAVGFVVISLIGLALVVGLLFFKQSYSSSKTVISQ
ncbi:MAG: MFS transporter [Proteobacteria bacterium]|nr:MFS transporter [Pseudomonadota bacterium]